MQCPLSCMSPTHALSKNHSHRTDHQVICFELYQKVIEEIREECYYLIMAGKRLIECRLCNSPGRAVQIGGSRYEFKRTQLFNIEGFYTGGN